MSNKNNQLQFCLKLCCYRSSECRWLSSDGQDVKWTATFSGFFQVIPLNFEKEKFKNGLIMLCSSFEKSLPSPPPAVLGRFRVEENQTNTFSKMA